MKFQNHIHSTPAGHLWPDFDYFSGDLEARTSESPKSGFSP